MKELKVIARIESEFPAKFGIPRQSGLAGSTKARIVFFPEFRDPSALRGLEDYSHLWIIWEFSEAVSDKWSPTVRPPRLGGNKRMGVFATRSPFRPNPVGLSCVKIESIQLDTPDGPVINVLGADLLDGTPIFDIKPYLPYVDSHPEALGGFSDDFRNYRLAVEIPDELSSLFDGDDERTVTDLLANDPRPSYQNDPERIYGMRFRDYEIKFKVSDGVVSVISVEKKG